MAYVGCEEDLAESVPPPTLFCRTTVSKAVQLVQLCHCLPHTVLHNPSPPAPAEFPVLHGPGLPLPSPTGSPQSVLTPHSHPQTGSGSSVNSRKGFFLVAVSTQRDKVHQPSGFRHLVFPSVILEHCSETCNAHAVLDTQQRRGLLDQTRAQVPYTPSFGACFHNIPQ